MAMFWLSTVILTVIAFAFVALPLFKSRSFDDELQRDELNKTFYQNRLEELEQEVQQGVASQKSDLIVDLKKSLLQDIPATEKLQPSLSLSPLWVFIPSVVLLLVVSYGTYMAVGASTKVSHWQNVNSDLSALREKLLSPEAQPLTKSEVGDLKLALRTRLHHQAEDAQGWLLLGRIAQSDGDAATAVAALKKAYKLDNHNPDIRFSYAESLMMSAEPSDQQRVRALLIGLLQDGYADSRIYSLLAFSAYQSENYEEAIHFWRMMQKHIGPDDKRYSMLERSIRNAEQKLGKTMTASGISITVTLSETVRLPAQGALIVSVHDGNGSPIPLAAARFPIGDFPRTVMLDDSNVMMQGQSLSQLSSLMVKARIDSDGNVATQEGDWYGESRVVKSDEHVTLTIDKKY